MSALHDGVPFRILDDAEDEDEDEEDEDGDWGRFSGGQSRRSAVAVMHNEEIGILRRVVLDIFRFPRQWEDDDKFQFTVLDVESLKWKVVHFGVPGIRAESPADLKLECSSIGNLFFEIISVVASPLTDKMLYRMFFYRRYRTRNHLKVLKYN